MTTVTKENPHWREVRDEANVRDTSGVFLASTDDLLDASIIELILLVAELDRLKAPVAEERRTRAICLAADLLRRLKSGDDEGDGQ